MQAKSFSGGHLILDYRFNHDHWNYDQAYAEMKQYDFYTSNGHRKQLDFDY